MDATWGTEPPIAAGKVRLRDVLKPRKTIIDYTYDFGDCREHRLPERMRRLIFSLICS
jgi:hypothetical protein